MKPEPELSGAQSITKADLARHLNVDPTSVDRIAASVGLKSIAGRYPWRRIWRTIHKTEGALLKNHHTTLTACGSPILDDIKNFEEELKTPLWDFPQMARFLGRKPETLARAIREGRVKLRFTELNFGRRTRRYRPLEVLMWRDERLLLDLPEYVQTTAASVTQNSDNGKADLPSVIPQNPQEKALFGAYASNKRRSRA